MRMNFIKIIAMVIFLSGIAGIAAANPCPDSNSEVWDDPDILDTSIVVLYEDKGSNTLEISVKHTNEDPVNGIPGFKEVCFQIPDMNGAEASWEINGGKWGAGINDDVAEFNGEQTGSTTGASGNPYNIPFDGVLHGVGTITFGSSPDTGQAISLVKIVGAECGTDGSGEPNSCYRRPQPPISPVPEASTIILISAGLLGIVLISRKYRN